VQFDVRSPSLDAAHVQVNPKFPGTQAHVAVAPHCPGNDRHWYIPGSGDDGLSSREQYSVPCAQKKRPHANVPAGGVQPPTSETSDRPWPFVKHSFT
jgi:hypothetical protein